MAEAWRIRFDGKVPRRSERGPYQVPLIPTRRFGFPQVAKPEFIDLRRPQTSPNQSRDSVIWW